MSKLYKLLAEASKHPESWECRGRDSYRCGLRHIPSGTCWETQKYNFRPYIFETSADFHAFNVFERLVLGFKFRHIHNSLKLKTPREQLYNEFTQRLLGNNK